MPGITPFPQSRGKPWDTRGQALYLDLGPGRRPLIALLTHIRRDDEVAQNGHLYHYRWWGDSPSLVLADVCLGGAGHLDWIEMAIQFNKRCRLPLSITTRDLPDLVTFADVNDPKSVMLVDPENLAAALGQGVSWRSMTLQVTDEPLTKGIDEHLPWVRGYQPNMRIPDLRSFQELNDFVNSRDFIRGM
jgi:hypothetical protein